MDFEAGVGGLRQNFDRAYAVWEEDVVSGGSLPSEVLERVWLDQQKQLRDTYVDIYGAAEKRSPESADSAWTDASILQFRQLPDRFRAEQDLIALVRDHEGQVLRLEEVARSGFTRAVDDVELMGGGGVSPGVEAAARDRFVVEVREAFERRFGTPGEGWKAGEDHVGAFGGEVEALVREVPARLDFEAEVGGLRQNFDRAYAVWEEDVVSGGSLPSEVLERVWLDQQKQLRDAYVDIHGADPARWRDMPEGVDGAWTDASTAQFRQLPDRFRAEQRLLHALQDGAEDFGVIQRRYEVPQERVQEHADSFRTDTATRHEEIFDPAGDRDLTAWLKDEKAGGDVFGTRLADLAELHAPRTGAARPTEAAGHETPGTRRPGAAAEPEPAGLADTPAEDGLPGTARSETNSTSGSVPKPERTTPARGEAARLSAAGDRPSADHPGQASAGTGEQQLLSERPTNAKPQVSEGGRRSAPERPVQETRPARSDTAGPEAPSEQYAKAERVVEGDRSAAGAQPVRPATAAQAEGAIRTGQGSPVQEETSAAAHASAQVTLTRPDFAADFDEAVRSSSALSALPPQELAAVRDSATTVWEQRFGEAERALGDPARAQKAVQRWENDYAMSLAALPSRAEYLHFRDAAVAQISQGVTKAVDGWRAAGHDDLVVGPAAESLRATLLEEFEAQHSAMADTGQQPLHGAWERAYERLTGRAETWIDIHTRRESAVTALRSGLDERTEDWAGPRFADWERQQLGTVSEQLTETVEQSFRDQLRDLRSDTVPRDALRSEQTAAQVADGLDRVADAWTQRPDTSPALLDTIGQLRSQTLAALTGPQEQRPPARSERPTTVGQDRQTSRAQLTQEYTARLDLAERVERQRPDAEALFRRITASAGQHGQLDEALEPRAEDFRRKVDTAFARVWRSVLAHQQMPSQFTWLQTESRWLDELDRIGHETAAQAQLSQVSAEKIAQTDAAAEAARERWAPAQADEPAVQETLEWFRASERALFSATYRRRHLGLTERNVDDAYRDGTRRLEDGLDAHLSRVRKQRAAVTEALRSVNALVADWERTHDRPLQVSPAGEDAADLRQALARHGAAAGLAHRMAVRESAVREARDAAAGGTTSRPAAASSGQAPLVDLAGAFAAAFDRLSESLTDAVERSLGVVAPGVADDMARTFTARAEAIYRQVVADRHALDDAVRTLDERLDELLAHTQRLLEFQALAQERVAEAVDSRPGDTVDRAGAETLTSLLAAAENVYHEVTGAQGQADRARILDRKLAALLVGTEDRVAFEAFVLTESAKVTDEVEHAVHRRAAAGAEELDAESLDRVTQQYAAAFAAEVSAWRDELAAHRFAPERTQAASARLTALERNLLQDLTTRLDDEIGLTDAVHQARATFDGLSQGRRLAPAAREALAEGFRHDWMAAHQRITGEHTLDLATWLAHESEAAETADVPRTRAFDLIDPDRFDHLWGELPDPAQDSAFAQAVSDAQRDMAHALAAARGVPEDSVSLAVDGSSDRAFGELDPVSQAVRRVAHHRHTRPYAPAGAAGLARYLAERMAPEAAGTAAPAAEEQVLESLHLATRSGHGAAAKKSPQQADVSAKDLIARQFTFTPQEWLDGAVAVVKSGVDQALAVSAVQEPDARAALADMSRFVERRAEALRQREAALSKEIFGADGQLSAEAKKATREGHEQTYWAVCAAQEAANHLLHAASYVAENARIGRMPQADGAVHAMKAAAGLLAAANKAIDSAREKDVWGRVKNIAQVYERSLRTALDSIVGAVHLSMQSMKMGQAQQGAARIQWRDLAAAGLRDSNKRRIGFSFEPGHEGIEIETAQLQYKLRSVDESGDRKESVPVVEDSLWSLANPYFVHAKQMGSGFLVHRKGAETAPEVIQLEQFIDLLVERVEQEAPAGVPVVLVLSGQWILNMDVPRLLAHRTNRHVYSATEESTLDPIGPEGARITVVADDHNREELKSRGRIGQWVRSSPSVKPTDAGGFVVAQGRRDVANSLVNWKPIVRSQDGVQVGVTTSTAEDLAFWEVTQSQLSGITEYHNWFQKEVKGEKRYFRQDKLTERVPWGPDRIRFEDHHGADSGHAKLYLYSGEKIYATGDAVERHFSRRHSYDPQSTVASLACFAAAPADKENPVASASYAQSRANARKPGQGLIAGATGKVAVMEHVAEFGGTQKEGEEPVRFVLHQAEPDKRALAELAMRVEPNLGGNVKAAAASMGVLVRKLRSWFGHDAEQKQFERLVQLKLANDLRKTTKLFGDPGIDPGLDAMIRYVYGLPMRNPGEFVEVGVVENFLDLVGNVLPKNPDIDVDGLAKVRRRKFQVVATKEKKYAVDMTGVSVIAQDFHTHGSEGSSQVVDGPAGAASGVDGVFDELAASDPQMWADPDGDVLTGAGLRERLADELLADLYRESGRRRLWPRLDAVARNRMDEYRAAGNTRADEPVPDPAADADSWTDLDRRRFVAALREGLAVVLDMAPVLVARVARMVRIDRLNEALDDYAALDGDAYEERSAALRGIIDQTISAQDERTARELRWSAESLRSAYDELAAAEHIANPVMRLSRSLEAVDRLLQEQRKYASGHRPADFGPVKVPAVVDGLRALSPRDRETVLSAATPAVRAWLTPDGAAAGLQEGQGAPDRATVETRPADIADQGETPAEPVTLTPAEPASASAQSQSGAQAHVESDSRPTGRTAPAARSAVFADGTAGAAAERILSKVEHSPGTKHGDSSLRHRLTELRDDLREAVDWFRSALENEAMSAEELAQNPSSSEAAVALRETTTEAHEYLFHLGHAVLDATAGLVREAAHQAENGRIEQKPQSDSAIRVSIRAARRTAEVRAKLDAARTQPAEEGARSVLAALDLAEAALAQLAWVREAGRSDESAQPVDAGDVFTTVLRAPDGSTVGMSLSGTGFDGAVDLDTVLATFSRTASDGGTTLTPDHRSDANWLGRDPILLHVAEDDRGFVVRRTADEAAHGITLDQLVELVAHAPVVAEAAPARPIVLIVTGAVHDGDLVLARRLAAQAERPDGFGRDVYVSTEPVSFAESREGSASSPEKTYRLRTVTPQQSGMAPHQRSAGQWLRVPPGPALTPLGGFVPARVQGDENLPEEKVPHHLVATHPLGSEGELYGWASLDDRAITLVDPSTRMLPQVSQFPQVVSPERTSTGASKAERTAPPPAPRHAYKHDPAGVWAPTPWTVQRTPASETQAGGVDGLGGRVELTHGKPGRVYLHLHTGEEVEVPPAQNARRLARRPSVGQAGALYMLGCFSAAAPPRQEGGTQLSVTQTTADVLGRTPVVGLTSIASVDPNTGYIASQTAPREPDGTYVWSYPSPTPDKLIGLVDTFVEGETPAAAAERLVPVVRELRRWYGPEAERQHGARLAVLNEIDIRRRGLPGGSPDATFRTDFEDWVRATLAPLGSGPLTAQRAVEQRHVDAFFAHIEQGHPASAPEPVHHSGVPSDTGEVTETDMEPVGGRPDSETVLLAPEHGSFAGFLKTLWNIPAEGRASVLARNELAAARRLVLRASAPDRAAALAFMKPELRRDLATDPKFVDDLRAALTPREFAETAARLIVDTDPGVARAALARQEAQRQVVRMFHDPETTARVLKAGGRVVVVPRNSRLTDLAHLQHLKGSEDSHGRKRDRAVGMVHKRVAYVPEENLLGDPAQNRVRSSAPDGYSYAVHEMAHLLHMAGLTRQENETIEASYAARLAQGDAADWPDGSAVSGAEPYSAVDATEYFATLVSAYLGTNGGTDPATGSARNNGTQWVRTSLAAEPDLLSLLEKLFTARPSDLYAAVSNPVRATEEEEALYRGFREFMQAVSPEPDTLGTGATPGSKLIPLIRKGHKLPVGFSFRSAETNASHLQGWAWSLTDPGVATFARRQADGSLSSPIASPWATADTQGVILVHVTGGADGLFRVRTAEGQDRDTDGVELARELVADAAFAAALARAPRSAVVLLSDGAGPHHRPGGAAHAFARSLREAGHAGQVYVSTGNVSLLRGPASPLGIPADASFVTVGPDLDASVSADPHEISHASDARDEETLPQAPPPTADMSVRVRQLNAAVTAYAAVDPEDYEGRGEALGKVLKATESWTAEDGLYPDMVDQVRYPALKLAAFYERLSAADGLGDPLARLRQAVALIEELADFEETRQQSRTFADFGELDVPLLRQNLQVVPRDAFHEFIGGLKPSARRWAQEQEEIVYGSLPWVADQVSVSPEGASPVDDIGPSFAQMRANRFSRMAIRGRSTAEAVWGKTVLLAPDQLRLAHSGQAGQQFQGSDVLGRTLSFAAEDVRAVPFADGATNPLGIAYPVRADDGMHIEAWAAAHDGGPHVVREHTDRAAPRPVVAPWADTTDGLPPLFVYVAGREDGFKVALGERSRTGDFLWVDGRTMAEITLSDPQFRTLLRKGPRRPVVLLAEGEGPTGQAVHDFARRIAQEGNRPVYVPSVFVRRGTGDSADMALVLPRDGEFVRSATAVRTADEPETTDSHLRRARGEIEFQRSWKRHREDVLADITRFLDTWEPSAAPAARTRDEIFTAFWTDAKTEFRRVFEAGRDMMQGPGPANDFTERWHAAYTALLDRLPSRATAYVRAQEREDDAARLFMDVRRQRGGDTEAAVQQAWLYIKEELKRRAHRSTGAADPSADMPPHLITKAEMESIVESRVALQRRVRQVQSDLVGQIDAFGEVRKNRWPGELVDALRDEVGSAAQSRLTADWEGALGAVRDTAAATSLIADLDRRWDATEQALGRDLELRLVLNGALARVESELQDAVQQWQHLRPLDEVLSPAETAHFKRTAMANAWDTLSRLAATITQTSNGIGAVVTETVERLLTQTTSLLVLDVRLNRAHGRRDWEEALADAGPEDAGRLSAPHLDLARQEYEQETDAVAQAAWERAEQAGYTVDEVEAVLADAESRWTDLAEGLPDRLEREFRLVTHLASALADFDGRIAGAAQDPLPLPFLTTLRRDFAAASLRKVYGTDLDAEKWVDTRMPHLAEALTAGQTRTAASPSTVTPTTPASGVPVLRLPAASTTGNAVPARPAFLEQTPRTADASPGRPSDTAHPEKRGEMSAFLDAPRSKATAEGAADHAAAQGTAHMPAPAVRGPRPVGPRRMPGAAERAGSVRKRVFVPDTAGQGADPHSDFRGAAADWEAVLRRRADGRVPSRTRMAVPGFPQTLGAAWTALQAATKARRQVQDAMRTVEQRAANRGEGSSAHGPADEWVLGPGYLLALAGARVQTVNADLVAWGITDPEALPAVHDAWLQDQREGRTQPPGGARDHDADLSSPNATQSVQRTVDVLDDLARRIVAEQAPQGTDAVAAAEAAAHAADGPLPGFADAALRTAELAAWAAGHLADEATRAHRPQAAEATRIALRAQHQAVLARRTFEEARGSAEDSGRSADTALKAVLRSAEAYHRVVRLAQATDVAPSLAEADLVTGVLRDSKGATAGVALVPGSDPVRVGTSVVHYATAPGDTITESAPWRGDEPLVLRVEQNHLGFVVHRRDPGTGEADAEAVTLEQLVEWLSAQPLVGAADPHRPIVLAVSGAEHFEPALGDRMAVATGRHVYTTPAAVSFVGPEPSGTAGILVTAGQDAPGALRDLWRMSSPPDLVAAAREPVDVLERARVEKPVARPGTDGAGVRRAVAALLPGARQQLLDDVFSDEALPGLFAQALERATRHVGRHQVVVRVVEVSTAHSEEIRRDDRKEVRSGETETAAVTADRRRDPLNPTSLLKVPTPYVKIAVTVDGLTNPTASAAAASTERTESTETFEGDRAVRVARHTVDYEVSVAKPNEFGQTSRRVQVVHELSWPLHDSGRGEPGRELAYPQVSPRASSAERAGSYRGAERTVGSIVAAWLSGLGKVQTTLTRSAAHFEAGEEERLANWFGRLAAPTGELAKSLFRGTPVRETFRTRRHGDVEIVLAIGPRVAPSRGTDGPRLTTDFVDRADRSVTHRRSHSGRHQQSGSVSHQRGGSLTVSTTDLLAELIGPSIGITVSYHDKADTGWEHGNSFRQEISETDEGSFAQHEVELSFIVSAEALGIIGTAVEGTARLWLDTPPSSAGSAARQDAPAGLDVRVVPDQVHARYSLPDMAVDDIAGLILTKLGPGVRNPAEVSQRLRTFLRENARRILDGSDEVRFRPGDGAPQIFLRGALDRGSGEYLGVVSGKKLGEELAHGDDQAVTRGRARSAAAQLEISVEAGPLELTSETTVGTTTGVRDRVQTAAEDRQTWTSERPVRMRYPFSLDMAVGDDQPGPWESLDSLGSPAHSGAQSPTTGLSAVRSVYIVVPAPQGTQTGTPTPSGRDETEWEEADPDTAADGTQTLTLPPRAEIDTFKPVRMLRLTAARMLDEMPAADGWRASVGQVAKRAVFGAASASLGTEETGQAGPAALADWAAPPARTARLPLAVGPVGDVLRLEHHNERRLLEKLGTRDVVGEVRLRTRLTEPRVLRYDERHTFARTNRADAAVSGHQEHFRSAETEFGAGPPVEFVEHGEVVFSATVAAGVRHGDENDRSGSVETTTTERYTAPAYLVVYQAEHLLSTVTRHDVADPLGRVHKGDSRSALKIKKVPDAVYVWVEADELRQHLEQYAPAELGRMPALSRPKDDAGTALVPPRDAGHGFGTLDLHGFETVAQLAQGVRQQLRQARDQVATEGELLGRLDELGVSIIEDGLAAHAVSGGFASIVSQAVNGGVPFLRVHTGGESGKSELLVVLRAALVDGRHLDSLEDYEASTTTVTRRRIRAAHGGKVEGSLSLGAQPRSEDAGDAVADGLVAKGLSKAASAAAEAVGPSVTGSLTHDARTVRETSGVETVTVQRSGKAHRFVYGLRAWTEVHAWAYDGSLKRVFTRLVGGTPGDIKGVWDADSPFIVKEAIRLTVTADEYLAEHGETAALAEHPGSLRRDWGERGTGEFPRDATLVVPRLDVREIHKILDQLIKGEDAPGAPMLSAARAADLRLHTSSEQLSHHFTRALHPDGHRIELNGPTLRAMKVSLDLNQLQVVRAVGGTTASRSDEHTDGTVEDRRTTVAGAIALTEDPLREAERSWARQHTRDGGSGEPARTALPQDSLYLVSALMRATLTPEYHLTDADTALDSSAQGTRSGRSDVWNRPRRTRTATRVWIIADSAALRALGLTVPGPRPRRRPSGELQGTPDTA
ncbi:hypothetical protein ACQEV4_37865 [Streptomyces shenzhenensis]|uniref:hypothetical protein n=1 Tax=Streptomyces shenzhenensis TaxID=943815 RepID=UPI003D8C52F3